VYMLWYPGSVKLCQREIQHIVEALQGLVCVSTEMAYAVLLSDSIPVVQTDKSVHCKNGVANT